MTPDVGDVVTRARGLAQHVMSRSDLEHLARASGSGALKRSLEAIGYRTASVERQAHRSTAAALEYAIAHETGRRLALLGRWLARRRLYFAGVFEDDERRAIRMRLRQLASGGTADSAAGRTAHSGVELPRRMREELARASDLSGMVRALRKAGSPYAVSLDAGLRTHGADLLQLELGLDRAFADRARAAAERFGGRLLAWVLDGIDLDNAWSALAGQGAGFIDGGRLVSRERHAAIANEEDAHKRRLELAQVFAKSPLANVFHGPDVSLATLEHRAVRDRIDYEHRKGRVDPLGASPILECVMRLRAERADLRRINWGVAAGYPADVIVGQLQVAT